MDTMQFHLLVEPQMEPIPASVKLIAEFDEDLQIVDPNGKLLAAGRHCALEGSEEDLCAWLGPFERVYLGRGGPALQEFEAAHIGRWP